MTPTRAASVGTAGASLRRGLLLLLGLGLLGTAVDLVLLDHYEDVWQMPPLLLCVTSLLLVLWVGLDNARTAVRALRIAMVLCVASGLAGVALHYNGNREFQHEIDPQLAGWPLFVKVVTAKAPPALAPAVMAQLGFLGLLYTYRHPAFDVRVESQQEKS